MSWVLLSDRLPPENVQIEVLDSGNVKSVLVRRGNMFFLPDMSTYVYFAPKYWRSINEWQYSECDGF